jgi:hypothetical protein
MVVRLSTLCTGCLYPQEIHLVLISVSRTVPGSIPGGVTGFFSDISPSDRSMKSSQPLVKMSTRNTPGGKGGRCVRLTTSPPSRAECHDTQEPKSPGTLWATPGLLRDCFTFTQTISDSILFSPKKSKLSSCPHLERI